MVYPKSIFDDVVLIQHKPSKLDYITSWFTEPDYYGDEYGRTGYVKWRDRVLGVEKYQLDQRYGRIIHEIVSRVYVRCWVDDVEDKIDAWVDKNLPSSKLPDMTTPVIQKPVTPKGCC